MKVEARIDSQIQGSKLNFLFIKSPITFPPLASYFNTYHTRVTDSNVMAFLRKFRPPKDFVAPKLI